MTNVCQTRSNEGDLPTQPQTKHRKRGKKIIRIILSCSLIISRFLQEMRSSVSVSASLMQQQQDLTRKRPKVTRLDLEKMFQDSIQLCSEYNRLLKENESIKQELSKVDTLRSQRQNLISSVEGVISEKSKQLRPELKSSSWLVFKLKKQINQLKRQIQQKDKVLGDFSKNKYNEILREKQDEKNCLQSVMKTLKIPSDQPNVRLDQLYQLKQYQRCQQQRIQQLENELEVEERQVKKLIGEITHQKLEAQKIIEEQEELKQLQNMQRKSVTGDSINLQKDKKKANQESVMELQAIRDGKNQQIRELENTIEKIIEREKLERKKLEAEYATLAAKLDQACAKAPKIKIVMPTEPVKQVVQEEREPMVLVSRVRPSHIAQIGRFLRFNLAVKRYTHDRWKKELFPVEQQSVSIKTLTQSLQKQPFEISEFQDARLVARYLVEDDLSEKIYFNEKLTQTLPIVKSILQKVIGQIKIYSEEEQATVLGESSTILSKYRGLVIPALQTKAEKSQFLKQKDIIEVIDGCMLDLTVAHLDYIILYLFSFSKKLSELHFMDIEKLGVVPLNYSD